MVLQFLGRIHILILHLPIGIFILSLLLEWTNYLKWRKIDRSILTLIYGIGSGFAFGTCISGYLLYQAEGYQFELIQGHLWVGVLAMLFSFGVFFLSYHRNNKVFLMSNLLAILIAVTGHFGGSITHGEDFLSFNSGSVSDTMVPLIIDDIAEAYIFEDIIQYSVDTKCVSCHGPQNVKGKLRLDQPEFFIAGGKSEKNLLAAKDNEILRRFHLPESHKNHMPPDHKTQLSEVELNIWENWIHNGAKFDIKIKELKESSSVQQWVEKLIEESNDHEVAKDVVVPAYLPGSEDVNPVSMATLKEMESLEFVVLPAGESSPFIEVNTINIDTLTSKHWMLLEKTSKQIVRLKMSDHDLETTNFTTVGKMVSLVKLYLDNCNVKNIDLSHLKNLSELRYLNVSGNPSLSIEGLNHLQALPNLEKVFAFQTNISQMKEMGKTLIETGDYSMPILETDTTRVK